MKFLVISNLFPPAFLGGYEIGASWICAELKRQGHEIMIWTASCAVDGRQDGFRLLPQPQDDQYRWLPSGPTFYGLDVVGGLILRNNGPDFEPVREVLRDYFRSYPKRRLERRQLIEAFAPDQILVFNPACILDPVFAELACLPSLAAVPTVALVSDDWPLKWHQNHPLVYLWREWHRLSLHEGLGAGQLEALLRELGDWLSAQGLFEFNLSPVYTHACYTSAYLRDKCQPTLLHGVPTHVIHWGLPEVDAYPRHQLAAENDRPLRLAYCGQIQPHKGLIRVLQAMTHTRRACSLVVVGDDTTDYARFCRAYILEKGLGGRVWFTGKLPADEVAPLLAKQGDLLLLPSLRGGTDGFEEPFSIVLLQGMAMGMAVAASRSGGSVEAFVEHESGVFIDPDQPESMARLIDELDENRALVSQLGQSGRKRVEEEFTIQVMVERLIGLMQKPPGRSPTVLYAVRNATIDPANSGCVRVTRRLGRLLEQRATTTFATWPAGGGRLHQLRADQAEVLSRFNGPRNGPGLQPGEEVFARPSLSARHRGTWLLLPEIMPAEDCLALVDYARRHDLRCAAIFYDSIALLQPDFCSEEIRGNHAAYMRALARCDLVIPISHFSEDCLSDFWKETGTKPAQLATVLLPGEFSGDRLATGEVCPHDNQVRILCVSTLEPRKNHLRLLAAFRMLSDLCPGIRFQLDLVGNSYAGAMEITEAIQAAAAQDDRIKWWRVVDDQKLHQLYADAHFTIYPSLIEGFGLPILESIWHERPCICSDAGVMSELAQGGGCLATNVRDERCLAQAMAMIANDEGFRRRLTQEAASRPLKTWEQYANEVLDRLNEFSP